MIIVTPAAIGLFALGLILVAVGASAATWLICDRRAERWRDAADAAEERLFKLRAQTRQRRLPPSGLDMLPGLWTREPDTVVMRKAGGGR